MQQLNIEYFFPLTEQINLDLDFTLSTKWIEDWRAEQARNSVGTSCQYLISNGGTGSTGAVWTTISSNNLGNPSFTINVDAMPITIVSKKKPNFVKQFIYKALGMKWKSE
jgi:hypothetical protein